MADPNYSNTYEIEDTQTGKFYKVEGVDGTTREEAIQWLETLDEAELAQREIVRNQAQPTPSPTVQQPVESPEAPSITPFSNAPGTETVMTREFKDNPEVASYMQSLWNSGERDPDKFNAALSAKFGEEYGQSVNPSIIAGARERDAYYLAQGLKNPGNFVSTAATGLKDPVAPTGFLDTAENAVKRSVHNTANSIRGTAALGADIVGADETSDALLEEYVKQQAAIDFNYARPEGAESIQEIDSLGDAGLYATDIFGELLPQAVGGLGAGYIGSKIGQKAAEAGVLKITADKASKYGAATAVAANTVNQETGSAFGQTFMSTGEKAPVSSLLVGLASGGLEAIVPIRALNRISSVSKDEFSKRLVARLAREGVKDGFIEGGTESLQTFLQTLPEAVVTGENPIDGELINQMVDSFARGFLGGSTVAATTTAAQRTAPKGEQFIRAPQSKKRSKAYKTEIIDTVNDIAELINTNTTNWQNGPKVEVFRNFTGLRNVDNNAVGVYLGNGEVAINAENVLLKAQELKVSPDDVVNALIFHEGLGHYGLDKQFGERLDDTLLTWYDENESFKRSVDTWIKKNPGAYTGSDATVLARASEEVLAEMSEKEGQLPVTLYDTVANLVKEFVRTMGFDMKVSKREIKSLLALSHSRVGEAGVGTRILRSVAKKPEEELATNTPRYMYVGRKFEGKLDKDNLKEAQLAAARGYDVGPGSVIRKQTGWFKAKDGMWRNEVDDSLATSFTSRHDDLLHAIAESRDIPTSNLYYATDGFSSLEVMARKQEDPDLLMDTLPLKQVLDHPDLTAGYEQLFEDILVTRSWDLTKKLESDGEYYNGYWDPSRREIYINPKLNEREAMSTLLHEVQHVIQHYEGFETGGNTNSVMSLIPFSVLEKGAKQYRKYLKAELARAKYDEHLIKGMNMHPDVKAYREGMQEANFFYDMADEARNDGDNESADLREEQAAEAYEKANKAYQKLKEEATPEELEVIWRLSLENPLDNKLIEDTLKSAEMSTNYHRENLKKFEEALDSGDKITLRDILQVDKKATFSAYEHILGEVEARDVQRRWEQGVNRQETEPYTLEENIDPDSVFAKSRSYALADETSASSAEPKYMRLNSLEGVKINPEDLTTEELFEAENAVDILRAMTSDYTSEPISMDDLKEEAELRGTTVSELLRGKGQSPGEASRKLIMYDIAADKLNTKLTTLYAKLQSGQWQPKDKTEYLKTVAQFKVLASKIFGEHSEAGRMLRTLQELSYTKRKLSAVERALSGLQNSIVDDESFFKYARELNDQLQGGGESKLKKGSKVAANVLNLPRALMSSMDLSAPLRQGIFLIGRKEFWKAIPTMFRTFGSEESYKELNDDITSRDNYPIMVESRLGFSTLDGELSSREEDFMSQWAEYVPGVRRSNRAYTAYLNKLRADMFDSLYNKITSVDPEFAQNPDNVKAISAYISNATGRGDLGSMNNAAPQLTALLFSPRLLASRVRLLNPVTYAKMPSAVRKEAIRDLLTFGSLASMVMVMAVMAGMEVEWDPRSSDFGKLRIGNTRYDILGGFGQYITLGARMGMFSLGNAYESLTGEEGPDHYKTTSTGKLGKYNEGDSKYDQKAGDAWTRFGRSKLAPVPSYVVDYFEGENVVGEEFNPVDVSRFMPMFWGDALEMTEEYGVGQGLAMSVPGLFGVGVQNFQPAATDPKANQKAPKTFEDSTLEDGENEFISVEDGVVTVKEPLREEWTARINQLITEWMKDEMKSPEWKTMTDAEKAKAISEVRMEARAQAKEDMLESIGL